MKMPLYSVLILIAFSLSAKAYAEVKEYELNGSIVHLDANRIVVQSSERTFEIDRRDPHLKIPEQTKMGDRISVWYRLDVTRAKVTREQAGEAAPGSTPEGSEPVIDDRIFYDVRNSRENKRSGT
jgi:hypothetical protein